MAQSADGQQQIADDGDLQRRRPERNRARYYMSYGGLDPITPWQSV